MPSSRAFLATAILIVGFFVTTFAAPNAPYQRLPWVKPDEDLVLSWVYVVDSKGSAVPGLTANRFHIWEDDAEQSIAYFAQNSEPISVGLVVGADDPDIPLTFLKTTSWAEEYFVLADKGDPAEPGGTVIQSFTTDIQKLPRVGLTSGTGPDAIYVGLDYLKEAANHRKILLLVGTPSLQMTYVTSTMMPTYVLNRAVRQDAQIYSIESFPAFIEDISNPKKKKVYDPQYADNFWESIARATGGRAYETYNNPSSAEKVTAEVARGLETQYLIGYRSTNPLTDGKWRNMRVKLDPPSGASKLTVWMRSGYYAEKTKPGQSANIN